MTALWHWPLRSRPALRTAFAIFAIVFSVSWTVTAAVGILGQYLRATTQLRNGTAKVVEGAVDSFSPATPAGGMERFCINRICFRYSDFIVIAGFHHTSARGGPIHEGLRALIHYIGPDDNGEILRLEVAP
jgi:hypothetical protein